VYPYAMIESGYAMAGKSEKQIIPGKKERPGIPDDAPFSVHQPLLPRTPVKITPALMETPVSLIKIPVSPVKICANLFQVYMNFGAGLYESAPDFCQSDSNFCQSVLNFCQFVPTGCQFVLN